MFSSSPLDKSCVGPENCSSGRHNSPNRFPVGIPFVGDENQQSRIQLAVHKYNSSANTSLNSRCAVISPVRHNYLKTSLKAKNCEGDSDGISRSEKKNLHQYEGVGAFPTIHLKKSTVRYRPIKKFNDVKIPYPELPVNRYLSHLPEVCADLKSNTRSVLDVLEDLSGKKIHSKQESANIKPLSKGLGGDNLLNPSAVYKPLFVQKPKISSVLTRDNTTQTLYPFSVETPGPQISNSDDKNNDSDPRAELRRKLARQNNEIFASLSSSVSSSFALKRKIDKVLPARDDEQLTEQLATKKSKVSVNEGNSYNENGISKPNRSRTNLNDSVKSSKRSKFNEANAATSPNKDRLTTIFLDMQNASPKSQIFQSHSTATEKSADDGIQAPATSSDSVSHVEDSSGSKVSSPLVKGSTEASGSENGITESETASTVDTEKSTTPDAKKPNGSNFTFGKTTVGTISDDSSSGAKNENSAEKKDNNNQVLNTLFTFGKSNEKSAFGSFKFGTDKNVSSPQIMSPPKDPKILASNSTQIITPTSSTAVPQFSFVTTTSGAITTQQFNSPSTAHASPVQFGIPTTAAAAATTTTTTTSTSTTQSNSSVSTVQTPGFQFGAATTQNAPTTSSKPLFTFGQNSAPNKTTFMADTSTEKKSLPNGFQTSVATTTHSIQPLAFVFGQKPSSESPAKTITAENSENQTGTTSQCNTVSFSQSVTGLSTNSTTSTQNKTSSGQQTSVQPTSVFGQNVSQPATGLDMKFGKTSTPQAINGLGAKSEAGFLGNPSAPAFSQSNTTLPVKTSLFGSSGTGFGIPNSQASTGFGTPTSSTSGLSFGSPAVTQAASAFGNSSAPQSAFTFGASSTSHSLSGFGNSPALQSTSAFGVSSTTQSTSVFGSSSTQSTSAFGVSSTTQSTSVFGSSSTQSTSAFGVSSTTQSTPVFGSSSTQSTSAFGVSSTTQSTPVFGSSSTQSTSAFGVSSTTQSTPVFGSSSTQSTSAFGASSTTQSTPLFGVSSSTQSTSAFGVSSTTQSTPVFGVPSSTQSTSAFGVSSTTQSTPAFGVSSSAQSTPTFGVSSTTQPTSTFGVSTTTQSAPAFGVSSSPPSSAFGTPASSVCRFPVQATTSFGAPSVTASSAFGTSQPSFSQPLGNKPAPTLGQSSSVFGQSSGFSWSPAFSSSQNSVQAPSFNTAFFPPLRPFSSSAPVTFGTTPSPSVISFGSSTSASSGSSFNFGTPTPSPFGQSSNASPGTPFAVPGTFSIGSGTSQSRPRAASRPRRRP